MNGAKRRGGRIVRSVSLSLSGALLFLGGGGKGLGLLDVSGAQVRSTGHAVAAALAHRPLQPLHSEPVAGEAGARGELRSAPRPVDLGTARQLERPLNRTAQRLRSEAIDGPTAAATSPTGPLTSATPRLQSEAVNAPATGPLRWEALPSLAPLQWEALPSPAPLQWEALPSPAPLQWEALPSPAPLQWEALPASGPVLSSSAALPSLGHQRSPDSALVVEPLGGSAGRSTGGGTVEGQAANDAYTVVAHAVAPEVIARSAADLAAPIVETFPHPTEIGGPAVFQAVGHPVDGWIEVRLPVRPNGTTGWIPLADVELTRNPYRIEVDVAGYELTVFHRDEPMLTTVVAIGTGATPTPIGDFYLTELLRPPDPNGLYGPYAYGLSGFSETLTSFNGGPGIIGIHGTDRPDLLGTNVSRGCIRLDNDVIAHIVQFLPLGTPISIS